MIARLSLQISWPSQRVWMSRVARRDEAALRIDLLVLPRKSRAVGGDGAIVDGQVGKKRLGMSQGSP